MEIVVMKLITGEEVVAKKMGDNFFDKPRVFHAMQDPQTGQVRAGLMPWLMSAPDVEVLIPNQHIIAMIEAPLDLEKAYLQQTSSIALQ